jgi:hypothetical protein
MVDRGARKAPGFAAGQGGSKVIHVPRTRFDECGGFFYGEIMLWGKLGGLVTLPT